MNEDVAGCVRELLVRVAQGDRAAFARVYDLTVRDVLAITTSVLRDHSQAQEVAQEVYLELWRRAARIDPDRAAVHLIRQMARRRAIDRVRSVQADRERDHAHALRHQGLLRDEAAEVGEVRVRFGPVAEAIRGLPVIHRDVLFLAYVRGFSHSEIASELQLPLGTVKTRLRDSLLRLRAQLAPGEGGGEEGSSR